MPRAPAIPTWRSASGAVWSARSPSLPKPRPGRCRTRASPHRCRRRRAPAQWPRRRGSPGHGSRVTRMGERLQGSPGAGVFRWCGPLPCPPEGGFVRRPGKIRPLEASQGESTNSKSPLRPAAGRWGESFPKGPRQRPFASSEVMRCTPCRSKRGSWGDRSTARVRRVERLRQVRRDVRAERSGVVHRVRKRRLRALASDRRGAADARGAPCVSLVRAAPLALPRP
jgi:hypothetical protein